MVFAVNAGAEVAVVAPAGPVDPTAFLSGIKLLRGRYRVIRAIDPNDSRHPNLPYLMGTDSERAQSLNDALADDRVQAIFCARGGYGTMRILPLIDQDMLGRRRRPLVGFSDCTALHLLSSRLGVPSIHGPVVTQLANLGAQDHTALFNLLAGQLPRLDGLNCIAPGQARGPVIGGNLSLITRLLGTPFMPDLSGALLLFEDVNEAPYSIDRQLTQLLLAGLLQQVSGVIIGALHRCDAEQGIPPVRLSAAEVITDRLSGLGIPVVSGAPIGHGAHNQALPLGLCATLDADNGTLVYRSTL